MPSGKIALQAGLAKSSLYKVLLVDFCAVTMCGCDNGYGRHKWDFDAFSFTMKTKEIIFLMVVEL